LKITETWRTSMCRFNGVIPTYLFVISLDHEQRL
jgi:hypothetical protein